LHVNSAEIVISAVDKSQYPQDNFPEIVLAGRSNVGKSSFINALLNRKNLARISGKPGKTQTLNFYLINESFYFVDVPGYGYAKVSKTQRAKWGKMFETYLANRKNLCAVVSLIDFRHPPTKEDLQMYEFLKCYNLPVVLVATKVDKVPKSRWPKHEKIIKEKLGAEPSDQFILFSAETKHGRDEMWKTLDFFRT